MGTTNAVDNVIIDSTPEGTPANNGRANQGYLSSLGLKRNPFPIVPESQDIFLTKRLEVTLRLLLDNIQTRKGFVLIVGEVGLGKTTLSRRILQHLDNEGTPTSLVFNTQLQGLALLKAINKDFGIQSNPENDLEREIEGLNKFLLEHYQAGKNCAILIDDAQNLTIESLELIRLISNLETSTEKLVQVILIGQTELEEKLDTYELRQLKSRITMKSKVEPLSSKELKQYVYFRLNSAGSSGNILVSDSAFKVIHRLTQGCPRRINILMERCLYALYALNAYKIIPKLVKQVALEIGIEDDAKANKQKYRLIAAYTFAIVIGLGSHFTLNYFSGNTSTVENTSSGQSDITLIQDVGEESIVKSTALVSEEVIKPSKINPNTVTSQPEVHEGNALSYSHIPTEFISFVKAYGLEEYLEELHHGITSRSISTLAKKIWVEKGLKLVELKTRPRSDLWNLPTWNYIDLNNYPKTLLVWQPQIWVDNFYYGYKGADALTLQQKLADLGFYPRDAVDGKVGRFTMRALISAQEYFGLPLTGQADVQTQFYIDLFLGSKS
jgi:general secretion pathway protein A